MGILGRIKRLFKRSEKQEQPQTGQEEHQRESIPVPAQRPVQETANPAPQPPSAAAEPSAFEGKGENAVKLPVKRHVLKGESEDPFSDKEREKIFQDGKDLVALFRSGEFSENEALRRQRLIVMKRLKRKKLGPDAVKDVLDNYEFYFKKELDGVKVSKNSRFINKNGT